MPRLPVERVYYSPIERLSREELLGLQWHRLKTTLAYAYTVPFYRRLWGRAGIAPDDIETSEDFRRLPLITKADILQDQREYPPLGSVAAVAENKLVRLHLTSGTSGKGQQVQGLTQPDLEMMTIWCRGLYLSGVRRGDLAVNITPTSLSPSAGTDSRTYGSSRKGVNFMHLGATFSTEQKMQLMKRFNPHFIWGVSRRMMRACQELGIVPRRDFPRLKVGWFSGWGGEQPSNMEELLEWEEFLDCRLASSYGTTETNTAPAHTCEKGIINNGKLGQYHIWEDYVLFEFLDRETREPVAFGEPGEIVLTNLTHEASPLIRFATNDKAISYPPTNCDCGRPFIGMGIGSVERYDEMLKIKGVNVWPSAVNSVLFSHKEVEEYQARVFLTSDGHEEVTIVVELTKESPAQERQRLCETLAQEVRETVGIRMILEEAKETLPRYQPPLTKERRWTDLRKVR